MTDEISNLLTPPTPIKRVSRTWLTMTFDTETGSGEYISNIRTQLAKKGCPNINELLKNVAIQIPLIYDIGWVVADKYIVYKRCSYLVEETFFRYPTVFDSAYYRDKRDLYLERLDKGETICKPWKEILFEFISDALCCKLICAFNAQFDIRAVRETDKYISKRLEGGKEWKEFFAKQTYRAEILAGLRHSKSAKKKAKKTNSNSENPVLQIGSFTFPILDIWTLCCDINYKMINITKYKKWCINTGKTGSSGVYFTTNAETCFQYLEHEYSFVEEHTALADAEIEAKLVRKAWSKKGLKPMMKAFPFRDLGTTIQFCADNPKKYKEKVVGQMTDYLNKKNPDWETIGGKNAFQWTMIHFINN